MKNLLTINLAMLALSTAACSSPSNRVTASLGTGRIIEFKSDASGFDTKNYFYEGENEVIAFDAQFTEELAKASIQHLRKFTNKPISWLVITHPNPDKFNGASVFKKEGARIISSLKTAQAIPTVHAYKKYYFEEVAKMFEKGTYPQPIQIDQTFTGKVDLVLKGGQRIELRELSQAGVSSTQTLAFIPQAKALFVGDLVHHKAHAWLEGGIENGKATPRIQEWIASLNELNKIYPRNTIVYGGRGVSGPISIVTKAQIKYLKTAVTLIQNTLSKMGDNASEFNGANAGNLYKNLATQFEKAFPDYELSYMIEYGSYGLVQHLLSK